MLQGAADQAGQLANIRIESLRYAAPQFCRQTRVLPAVEKNTHDLPESKRRLYSIRSPDTQSGLQWPVNISSRERIDAAVHFFLKRRASDGSLPHLRLARIERRRREGRINAEEAIQIADNLLWRILNVVVENDVNSG